MGIKFESIVRIPTYHLVMLTRHLYRYDEVRAALLWCIAKGRVLEGIFWAQEFLDSEMYDELFQVLFEGWLWFVGVRRMEWPRAFWVQLEKEEIDAEAIMLLAYTLLRLPVRDCSVAALLLLGPDLQTLDRLPPTPKTDAICKASLSKKEALLLKYLRTGKALSAWRLAVGNDWQTVKSLLASATSFPTHLQDIENIYERYFSDQEDMKLAIRAALVGFVCLSPKQQAASTAEFTEGQWKKDVENARAEWEGLLGRRGRRIYAIPCDCLSWTTSRGYATYQKHTLRELRGISLAVLGEKGCAYWQRRLEEANPSKDDETFEAFMDEEFPDDIPDEWSKKDQEKSHGYGVLNLKEGPMLGKLLRKWFHSSPCCLVWQGLEKMIRSVEKDAERVWWGSGHFSVYCQLPEPLVPPQALKKELRLAVQVSQEGVTFVAAPRPVVVEEEEEEQQEQDAE